MFPTCFKLFSNIMLQNYFHYRILFQNCFQNLTFETVDFNITFLHHTGVQAKCLGSDRGRISATQILESINGDDPHYPATRLVCIENTANKGGGSFYSLAQLQEISKVGCTLARQHLALIRPRT